MILLLGAGLSQAEVARQTGVPRGTVRTWITGGPEEVLAARRRSEHSSHYDGSDTCELVPRMLLRGLIHSDGYRGVNRIKGRYAYPRYSFSNRSDDIRQIFIDACGQAGVVARPNGRWQVSVSRRDDVALMDSFVGPKR